VKENLSELDKDATLMIMDEPVAHLGALCQGGGGEICVAGGAWQGQIGGDDVRVFASKDVTLWA
jgi:hypothetical protein